MAEISGAQDETAQEAAARRLLDKLRDFATGLSSEERALLGALLAPGVALAFREQAHDDDDDVAGFGVDEPEPVGWRPDRLPHDLAHALVARGPRIVEL